MSNVTPPNTQSPLPASGGTGPGGLRIWGPAWLTAFVVAVVVVAGCYIAYLLFMLIGAGNGEDVALVLRAIGSLFPYVPRL
jgi:hypothetical protein